MMPCAMCGRKYDVPVVSGFGMNAYRLRCDACSERIERQEQAIHVRTIVRNSGAMTDDDLMVTFDGNKPEKEKQNQAAWDAARKWADSGLPKNVFVYGNPGTGKTRLALCLVNALMGRGESAGIVRCSDVQRLARAFQSVQEPFVSRYSAPVNLVVDDIDAAEWTPEGIILLRTILDTRAVSVMAGRTRRLIVTANADFKAVFEHLNGVMGERATAASMLDRMKPIMPLKMDGKSLRG